MLLLLVHHPVCMYQQFEHDTVLIPKETAWFGYYPEGAFDPVLPPNQVCSILQLLGRNEMKMERILIVLDVAEMMPWKVLVSSHMDTRTDY